MKDLIEIFKMADIDPKTRARLIIKLGTAINCQYGSNLTEPVVFELVSLLDPENEILNNPHYKDAR